MGESLKRLAKRQIEDHEELLSQVPVELVSSTEPSAYPGLQQFTQGPELGQQGSLQRQRSYGFLDAEAAARPEGTSGLPGNMGGHEMAVVPDLIPVLEDDRAAQENPAPSQGQARALYLASWSYFGRT